MDDLEQKLNTVLNDPEMMGKILSMAQSLGRTQEAPSEASFDPAMLRQMAGLARNANLEPRQQNLLKALEAYLPPERLRKLEKAMRAAKMARMAGSVLGATRLFAGR
jgi:hypothetical protein